MIDADTNDVPFRMNQLLDSLDQPRQPNECIVLAIPKRNIETWIHHMIDVAVSETDVYPKFYKNESACKKYVDTYYAKFAPQNDPPPDAPPSFRTFHEELKRLSRLQT